MKIIHSAAGNSGKESAPGKPKTSAAREKVSEHSAAPFGDPMSLRAMLDNIRLYRAGSLPLQSLVSELEFHLQALIMDDHHWQSAFFERWRELDRQQSLQLARGEADIDPAARQRIDAAIEDLRQLITSVLSGLNTR